MEKFKLAVVNKPDLIFPKGQVLAILKPGEIGTVKDFSEYEKSGQSFFKIVEVDKVESFLADEKLFFEGNQFKKKKRKDLKHPHKTKIKKHPHPPLKKGSLIWDYGPGRTYSTPQLAFSACLAFWGLDIITENQIIRGWSGEYAKFHMESVLQIDSLVTDGPNGARLIIDVEDGEEVIFRHASSTTNYMTAAILGHFAGADNPVNDVIIDGIKFLSCSYGGAISVQQSFIGMGTDPYDPVRHWKVTNCKINREPNNSVFNTQCIVTNGAKRFEVENCNMQDLYYGVGNPSLFPFVTCNIPQVLTVKGSNIQARIDAVQVRSNSGMGTAFHLANCLIKGGVSKRDTIENSFSILNCLFLSEYEGAVVFYFQNCDFLKARPAILDGNIYPITTDFLLDKNGYATFDEWQRALNADIHSKQADPVIYPGSPDLKPEPSSPIWGWGQNAAYADINGRVIAQGITDCGPWQETLAKKYSGAACGYCDIDEVKDSTGVLKENLDQTTDVSLDTILCQWIGEVSDLIDKYCETSWEIGNQPQGIRRAAIVMMAKVVAVAVQRRKSPFITINNFSVKMVADDLFSDDVKALLDEYKEPALSVEYNGNLGIGVGSADEVDDPDGL